MRARIEIVIDATPESLARLFKAMGIEEVGVKYKPGPKAKKSIQCAFIKRKWGNNPAHQCENGVSRKCRQMSRGDVQASLLCPQHCRKEHECIPERQR